MEVWKEIPGYEGYYSASNLGRIMRLRDGGKVKAGHILAPQKDECGYMRLRLSKNGSYRMHKVHRLVLFAFVGIRDETWDGNHKNLVRNDNRLENLEWLKHRENVSYSARLGNYSKPGEKNPKAKISRLIAKEIRDRRKLGHSLGTICDALKLSRHIVADVSSGRSWC